MTHSYFRRTDGRRELRIGDVPENKKCFMLKKLKYVLNITSILMRIFFFIEKTFVVSIDCILTYRKTTYMSDNSL